MQNPYKIEREIGNKSDIVLMSGSWTGPAVTWSCNFETSPEAKDDASEKFNLLIEGGQVEKGEIKMCGNWERAAFIEILELIIQELKK